MDRSDQAHDIILFKNKARMKIYTIDDLWTMDIVFDNLAPVQQSYVRPGRWSDSEPPRC